MMPATRSPIGDTRPTLSEATRSAERVHIVVTGHVDHGKSTVVGRILTDTGSLPDGKLEAVRAVCQRRGTPFEPAFLLDALRDEREQGITIDAARVFFKTERRHYVIIDAPGHLEFLKNMITGASRAEAALLVIDGNEGIRENSRRHGFMLSMLGIKQVAVVVNKMDLVNHQQTVFDRLVAEYRDFLSQFGLVPAWFIPVSARNGDNIAGSSRRLSWYSGPTVVEALDSFEARPSLAAAALRLPVQGVYKFPERGDDRRIVAGTVESGGLSVGDDIVFYPSGKHARVRTLESFSAPPSATVSAEQAVGFTLADQIYVARGEIATRAAQPRPHVGTRLRVNLFWLGKRALTTDRDYLLRLGTARVTCRIRTDPPDARCRAAHPRSPPHVRRPPRDCRMHAGPERAAGVRYHRRLRGHGAVRHRRRPPDQRWRRRCRGARRCRASEKAGTRRGLADGTLRRG